MSPMKILAPDKSSAALSHLVVVALAGGLVSAQTFATVRYVDVNSASPAPPYTNWAMAATTIQAAIDAAVAGDEIVVTNGMYATGGRAIYGVMTNRVAVTKPLLVRSVNGPEFTVIQGRQVPGDGAIRCVYLTNGASLSGFTLTNGATRDVDDSPTYRQSGGGGVWCGSAMAVVSNCVIMRNSGTYSGGAYGGTLINCTLTGNSARLYGGGALGGYLTNCTLSGNTASYSGGGAVDSVLNNCTLTGNSATIFGGGTAGGTLNNCVLTDNWAHTGGGAGNSALTNCTLTSNRATYGGGATSSILNNCIVYFNNAPDGANHTDCTLNFCCTAPLPIYGIGNITLDPQLADALHLSSGSPCRGAGSTEYVTGTDIDGQTWANPPSIGCDEYQAGPVTGSLNVSVVAAFTNVATGFAVNFTGRILGHASSNSWDFGDGTIVHGPFYQPVASHSWTNPGDYAVSLSAFNQSYPGGISATVTVHVVETPVHYVAVDSTSPAVPYTSWATAATNIQDAIDAGVPGALVMVTNGTYATGGRAGSWNLVTIEKPLALRSVNGPKFTVIDGGGAFACVYLTNDASLAGFTLTNGVAGYGGGVYCESASAIVSNCILVNNWAYDMGGGACGGTLNHCVLSGNGSEGNGGGAYLGTLNNCTLSGNTAGSGGGASGYADNDHDERVTLKNCTVTDNSSGGVSLGRLTNCIVYFNIDDGSIGAANYQYSEMNYCCTTPLPTGGIGNIASDPQLASASHLNATSPCRGAGSADCATGTDIDGEAWNNPPSIGCDEYHAGPATGPLSVSVAASFTNVAAGFTVNFTGRILGHASSNAWDFGDGTIVHSQIYRPFASYVWPNAGEYTVVLRAYNESYPGGVSATVTVHVATTPVHYVAADSTNPVAPYTSWVTAARSIQDAVDTFDAGTVPGALVLVTNGTYATGGRAVHGTMTNRVAVDRPFTVRSVNGPQFTVIQGHQLPGTTNGDGAIRCVYLTNGASLSGFTMTKGATRTAGDYTFEQQGGGAWCESGTALASNCVLTGNSARTAGGGVYQGSLTRCTLTGNSASYGGGSYGSTLINCTVTGNSASQEGGGAYDGTLNNCTLTGNSAGHSGGGVWGGTMNGCILRGNLAFHGGGAAGVYDYPCTLNNCTLTGNSARSSGGGAHNATLNNCIVYFNTAPIGVNYYNEQLWGGGLVLNYCCTTPMHTNGVGNITNVPAFVNVAAGDLHLRHDSPCIDAGTDLSAFFTQDFDGNLRPLDGNGDGLAVFDIGAYEFDRRSCMPVLTAQPQSQTVNEGGTATFTVAADGLTPFLYQWRFNGTDISAATHSRLTLAGVQTSQGGFYSVRVTNDCGDVVSPNALLRVNRPPLADASATPTLVISANGIDACVGLDASRSSDLDGDSLEYRWLSTLNVQPSTPLATGLVAVVTLPVGTNLVQLVVTDGFASSTNTITVTVLTTGQGVQRLIALVSGSNLQHPQPLVATLAAALASLGRGDLVPAANQLRAFQNKVRAQVAPESQALADALLAAAQQVIDALDGRNSRTGSRFHSVRHQPDGRVGLNFTGPAGGVHVIQASTNLLNWETIGVAVDHGDGQFEFEDAQASRFPTRFYRRISP